MKLTIDLTMGIFMIEKSGNVFSGEINLNQWTSIEDINWLTDDEYYSLESAFGEIAKLANN